jgi:hypothetical protein
VKEELTARDGDEDEGDTADDGSGAIREDVGGEQQHGKAKGSESAEVENPPRVGFERVRGRSGCAHGFDRSSRTRDETLSMIRPLPNSAIILLFRRPFH